MADLPLAVDPKSQIVPPSKNDTFRLADRGTVSYKDFIDGES